MSQSHRITWVSFQKRDIEFSKYLTKKKEKQLNASLRVPGAGIEPALPCRNWILNPARLPVPPPGRIINWAAKININESQTTAK